jgi:hypothetical protein
MGNMAWAEYGETWYGNINNVTHQIVASTKPAQVINKIDSPLHHEQKSAEMV